MENLLIFLIIREKWDGRIVSRVRGARTSGPRRAATPFPS